MKILIGTPIAGGEVSAAYARSMFHLATHVVAHRPEIALDLPPFVSGPIIAKTRNALASQVLEDPSITHLLFIDADMGFRPEAVLRMLDFDKDFVGCICPARKRNDERAFRTAKSSATAAEANALGLEFVAAGDLIRSPQGYVVERGFVRTRQIGAALTLIKRQTLERLRAAHPELCAPTNDAYRARGVRTEVFQGFEPVQDESGHFLSEDLSFCRRWERMGGEVWALIDEAIKHVGFSVFEGRYLDQLRALSTAADPALERRP